MEPQNSAVITQMLDQWRAGQPNAIQELIPMVYEELKIIATARLKNRPTDTLLSPTVLVNDVCIKLLNHRPNADKMWKNRAEFYGLVSTMMRHILIDHARRKQAGRHGGDHFEISIDPDQAGAPGVNMLHLDQILRQLEEMNQRQARIWQCHYLCGLKTEEMAELFDLSPTSVRRDLKAARAWVRMNLERSG